MIEIAALAATVVGSFVVPYAKMGLEGIAKAVTDKVSGAAADKTASVARRVWERITDVFDSDEEKTTIKLFEQDPDGLANSLTRLLEAKLRENEALAVELDELVRSGGPDQSAPATIMQQAGIAAAINMPHADFRQASNFNIVGVDQGSSRGIEPRPPSGPQESRPPGT